MCESVFPSVSIGKGLILACLIVNRYRAENYVFDGQQFALGKHGTLLPRLLQGRSVVKASVCVIIPCHKPQTCVKILK